MISFYCTFLKGQINNLKEEKSASIIVDVFKNNDDKKFVVDLFRKTIYNESEFNYLIESKLKNWEMERIANMDLILIKMKPY